VDLASGLRTVAKEMDAPRREAGLALASGVVVAASDPASMPLASAIVRLKSDASAIVLASSIELGQGVRTVLARIVAGELGLPPASVFVVTPDTAVTPYDWLTGASRSTTVMGLAVLEAVGDIRRKLAAMAAEACGMEPELVRVGDGAVTDGARRLSFAELFHQYFGIRDGEVLGTAQLSARSFGGRLAQAPLFWETVVAGCGIAVDPETGAIRLTSYTSVTEVGRALNPQMCTGQEEGAAVQGLGHTLYEELRYEDGQPVNATPVDYHVPTIDQVPEDFTTILLEDGEGPGPYGSRGMGEGGILPSAPAIANALSHALGIRVHDLPLTPERVWRALNARPGGPAGAGDR
jgi:CO/xanthine dehydrogenase Mo-binding subunit